MTNEHVCRYLELCDDGSYFCGGCKNSYRLAPEPPADARDAARYRWLRKESSQVAGPAAYKPFPDHGVIFEAELDAALDAAINAENRGAES